MRLLIASYRLPVTATEKDDEVVLTASSGGVQSGLTSYLESLKNLEYLWFGSLGNHISDKNQYHVQKTVFKDYNCIPVFLTPEELDKYYLGSCNKLLWPLFHGFTSFAKYSQTEWDFYQKVNQKFAQIILHHYKPDDVIWIHDYHLITLPKLLKHCLPNSRVGFFLHTPFPVPQTFCLLPKTVQVELLEGLLASDTIGFQTQHDVDNFLKVVVTLKVQIRKNQINYNSHTSYVGTFPIGINFNKFNDAAKSQVVAEEAVKIKSTFDNQKVILSMDRLDYTKGIIERLKGFETFLENYPEFHQKVSLLAVVVPSRQEIPEYQKTRHKIEEQIVKINQKFQTPDWLPITYHYTSLTFNSIIAHFGASDIMLITPLKDGMNLLSKEFLASKFNQRGVLILSKYAGAAQQLKEALIVDPLNPREISQAIYQACNMSEEEQIHRHQAMLSSVKFNNIFKWANNFLTSLSHLPLTFLTQPYSVPFHKI